MSWDVYIHPFRFLRVQECLVYKENGMIITAKFALQVKDGEDNHRLKERLLNSRVDVSVDEDYSKVEIEEIYAALKSFDVMAAERALHVNGITDALSIYQMKKMECFLPVLLKAYADAREEILSQLPFFQTLMGLGVDDPLGSLDRLNRQGFFHSWDQAILYRTMKRQRIICKGVLSKLTLRMRQTGRVLTGVIDTADRMPVSGIEIPALGQAPEGWVNLMRVCRASALYE